MSAFNLGRLRDFIPRELPRLPSWGPHESMNPDDDDDDDDTSTFDRTSHDLDPDALILAEPKPLDAGPRSFLDLVNECDNFPYYQTNPKLFFAHIQTYYAFHVKDFPDTELGYMLPSVVEIFRGLADWKIDDDDQSLTLMRGDTEAERSLAMETTTGAMRGIGHFKVLSGWRDELYPVYGPRGELLFSMERAATPLFGVVTYGCHLTAYTRGKGGEGESGGEEGGDGEIKIWVPRRAKTKQTYGGMLDNTVAGGLATGESPFEGLVRECGEEASLEEGLVRKGVRAAGTVTYFHIRDRRAGGETKLLMPECQFVYDLELPADVIPKPSDDEVEGFELMSVGEVKQAMRDGEFKPNCALVLLDFFVRHGILTRETDENYIEIVARLHRRLDFPVP